MDRYGLVRIHNPYAKFIKNILLGLILILGSTLSVTTGFFGLNKLGTEKETQPLQAATWTIGTSTGSVPFSIIGNEAVSFNGTWTVRHTNSSGTIVNTGTVYLADDGTGYWSGSWSTTISSAGNYWVGLVSGGNSFSTTFTLSGGSSYTVTLDRNGGSGGTTSVTATYGSNMPSATAPSRTGYTFAGYYDATSGGTQYYTGSMSSARTWNKTSNATLYARWIPNTYTLTVNLIANRSDAKNVTFVVTAGGTTLSTASGSATSNANSSRTYNVPYGSSVLITATRATGGGYNLVGGSSSDPTAQATNTTTPVSLSYTQPTTAITRYFKISQLYTVSYNGNGHTGGTVPDWQIKIHGVSLTLAANNLTRTGHTANGWRDPSYPIIIGTNYASGGTYTNNRDASLDARWTEIPQYTITLRAYYSGMTGPSLSNVRLVNAQDWTFDTYYGDYFTKSVYSGGQIGTLPTVEDSTGNWDFIGWRTGTNGSGSQIYSTTTATGNNTYYAHWGIDQYTLTFDSQGGTAISPVTQNKNTILDITISNYTPTRSGNWEFLGWNTQSNGSGDYIETFIFTQSQTLYAIWQNNAYWKDVSYEAFASGNGSMGNPYKIANARQLSQLSRNVSTGTKYTDQYFELTADINLLGYMWWPIGVWYQGGGTSVPFEGTFDGAGYKVYNLTINKQSGNAEGLFGSIAGATIKNLGVEGNIIVDKVSGSTTLYVGGIVGRAERYETQGLPAKGSTIINTYFKGDISARTRPSGTGLHVGGIAGSVGMPDSSAQIIKNTYFIGKIAAETYSGLLGNTRGTAGGIVGGIFAHLSPTSTALVDISESYVYFTAALDAKGGVTANAGQFVGLVYDVQFASYRPITISKGYYNLAGSVVRAHDYDVQNQSNLIISNVNRLTSGWSTQSNFGNLDFTNTWAMSTNALNDGMPVLQNVGNHLVTFNANGGTLGTGLTKVAVARGGTVAERIMGNPSWSGYTFVGWNNSSSATSSNRTGTTAINSAETWYAIWSSTLTVSLTANRTTAKDVTFVVTAAGVTLSTASGNATSNSTSSRTYNVPRGASVVITATRATGGTYNLVGGTSSNPTAGSGNTTSAVSLSAFTQNSATTRYFKMSELYTVSYNGNDNTGGTVPASQTKIHGVSLTLATNSLTRTGYTANAWYTTSTGTGGTAYTNGGSYAGNATITIYARWTINTYTLTIDLTANTTTAKDVTLAVTAGGTAVSPTSGGATLASGTRTYSIPYNSSVTMTATRASGGTYNLVGSDSSNPTASSSNTTSAVSAPSYTQGTTAITRYFKISELYTVSYDGNGNTGGTVPGSQTKIHGVSLTLATNSLTRTGYTANAWYTTASGTGGTAYANEANYTANAAVTLFARWNVNSYTISYDMGLGTATTNVRYIKVFAQASTANTATHWVEIEAINASGTNVALGKGFLNSPSSPSDRPVTWVTDGVKTAAQYYQASKELTLDLGSTVAIKDINVWTYFTNRAYYDLVVYISTDNTNWTNIYNSATQGLYVATSFGQTTKLNTNITQRRDVDPTQTVNYNASATLWNNSHTQTITVSATGVSAVSANYGITSQGAYPLTHDIFVRKGYTLIGWRNEATSTNYTLGQSFTMPAGNVTLSARWQQDTYTIRYEDHAGAHLGSETYTSTTATKTLTTTYTRTGYTFAGWKVKAVNYKSTYKGSADFAAVDDTIESVYTGSQGNITLTAQWTPITYTVAYNSNKPSGANSSEAIGGTMANTTYTYDQAQKLRKNTYTLVGWSFGGWNTAANGSGTSYTDEQELINLRTTSGTLTLYAKWTANTYTLTYNLNGGETNRFLNSDFANKSTQTAWDTTLNGTTMAANWGGYNGGVSNPETGYHAHLYELNGEWVYRYVVESTRWIGHSQSVTSHVVAGGTYTVMLDVYNEDNLGANLTSGIYASTNANTAMGFTNTTPSGTQAFRNTQLGVWQTVSVTFTLSSDYRPAGGASVYIYGMQSGGFATMYMKNPRFIVVSEPNPTQNVTYDSQIGTMIQNPTREGYTFAGWNTKADGTGSTISTSTIYNRTNINTLVVGNLNATLYAKWTANTYYVKYEQNKPTEASNNVGGTMANSTHTYGIASNLRNNAYTLTGWDFDGWSLTPEGAVVLANGASITNLIAVAGQTIKLYAKWKPKEFTVTLDRQIGTSGTTSVIAKYDHPMPTATAAAITGWTFDGYFDAFGGGGTQYYSAAMASSRIWNKLSNTTLYAKFITTITFDANGGSILANASQWTGSGATATKVIVYRTAITMPATTHMSREGYDFTNWNTAANGSGDAYSSGNTYLTPLRTLYAQWTPKTYTIELWASTNNATGGTNNATGGLGGQVGFSTANTNTTSTASIFGTPITIRAATKAGYGFIGWYTAKDGGTLISENLAYTFNTPAGNVTYYARFFTNYSLSVYAVSNTELSNAISGTVKINSGTAGANASLNIPWTKSTTITATANSGYTFEGWYTHPTSKTTLVSSNLEYTFNMPMANTEYYALFSGTTRTLTFDVNGGNPYSNILLNPDLNTGWSQNYNSAIEWNPLNPTVAPPTGINAPVVGFNPNGASSYWYSYGDYAPQTPGTQYTISLYVKTLDSNFSIRAYTADNAETGRQWAEYITVPNDGNWHRIVWAPINNPSNSQSDSLSFQFNVASTGAAGRTWFTAPQMEVGAVATAYNFSHIYVPAGATLTKYVPINPTREGYTFTGWNTAANGSGTTKTASDAKANSNETWYAQWTAKTTTITLDRQSGTGGTASVVATFDSAMPTATAPTRVGYTFGGYFDVVGGGGTQYYSAAMASAKNWDKDVPTATLYAKWTANTYTVTLDRQSGTGGTASVTATYDQVLPGGASAPTRTGYRFGGYFASANGAGAQYYNINMTATTTKWTTASAGTIYAKWDVNTYTVVYNANKPGTSSTVVEGTVANTSHTYGVSSNLNSNLYSLTGWTFEGYYLNAAGDGTKYTPGQPVSNLTSTHNGTVNLYAKWIENAYSISYQANPPSGATATGSMTNDNNVKYETSHTLKTNAFEIIGYEFSNWNTAANGSGTTYTTTIERATAVNGTLITLYAQWTPIKYTVTYDKNRPDNATYTVEGSTANSIHDFGVAKALTANGYTLSGWTFAGWSTQADGTGTNYTNGQSVTNLRSTSGTITLFAKWTANKYTITAYKNLDGTNTTSALMGHAAVGGTNITGMPSTFTNAGTQDSNITLTASVNSGFTFLGWYLNDSPTAFTTATSYSMKYIYASNITLYAKYKDTLVPTITFTANPETTISTPTSGNVALTISASDNMGVVSIILNGPGGTLATSTGGAINYTATVSGTYTVIATDAAGNESNLSKSIFIDKVKPVITVSPTTVTLQGLTAIGGYNFMAGVSATDVNHAGSTISQTGIIATYFNSGGTSINEATAREELRKGNNITVKYNVSDAAGNAADEKTRTVHSTSYKITFMTTSNHSTWGTSLGEVTVLHGESISTSSEYTGQGLPTNPTLTGYTFVGWNSATLQTTANRTATTTVTSNATWYSAWTPNNYDLNVEVEVNASVGATVNVIVNGVTQSRDTSGTLTFSVPYNTTLTPSAHYTSNGRQYNLAWGERGTSLTTAGDSVVGTGFTKVTGTQTYTSKIILTEMYSITYDANEADIGQNPPTNQYKLHGENYTVLANSLQKEGHTANGWNSLANGTGTQYVVGTDAALTYNVNSAVTLYANWIVNEYNLSITVIMVGADTTVEILVGGEVKATAITSGTHTIKIPYGTEVVLGTRWKDSTNTYNLSWGAARGDNLVAENTIVSGTGYIQKTSTEYRDITLTQMYAITYEGNGGAGSMAPAYKYHNEDYTVATNTFSRTGYTFTSWLLIGVGAYAPGATYTTDAIATFTAQWQAITFTVTLDNQGGTGDTTSVTATYGQALPSGVDAPTKTGYNFDGYYASQSGNGVRYYNTNMVGTATWTTASGGTIYAYWTVQTYTITYKAPEGVDISEILHTNPEEYTIETETITFSDPTSLPEGYSFIGWDPTSIQKGTTGNITVTAILSFSATISIIATFNEDTADVPVFVRLTDSEGKIWMFVFTKASSSHTLSITRPTTFTILAITTINHGTQNLPTEYDVTNSQNYEIGFTVKRTGNGYIHDNDFV